MYYYFFKFEHLAKIFNFFNVYSAKLAIQVSITKLFVRCYSHLSFFGPQLYNLGALPLSFTKFNLHFCNFCNFCNFLCTCAIMCMRNSRPVALQLHIDRQQV